MVLPTPAGTQLATRAPGQPGISRDERGLLEQLHSMLEAGLRRIRAGEQLRARRLAYEAALYGLRNDQIAGQLGRSRRTVEFQLNTIYRKLGLSRRARLVRLLG